jgi:crotonobetainyl-CoA:carnitine CoA-transferase CaiB-like acyl-CoA transferase
MDEDGVENPLRKITKWEEFDRSALTDETNDMYEEAIGRFFLRRTKQEITDDGSRRGINAAVLSNPADVLENQHLAARGFWKDLEHPELGTGLKYPGNFFLCSETQNRVERRAPLIGEDIDEIYGKELGLSGGEIAALKKAGVI